MCDASDFAVGAVLGQGLIRSWMLYTMLVKPLSQENYATTEKEFLAVVFACDKFRQYIVDS